jgi:predicted Zn-dependent protease
MTAPSTAPSRRLAFGLAALTALACGDIAAPVRDDLYEWRLEAPSIPGPGLDTLSFHWDRSQLPVRVWVEDTEDLPGHIARAIDVWEAVFLYREFAATLVSDSTTADVIVLGGSLGSPKLRMKRLHSAMAPECAGATDLDLDVASAELRLPIRLFIDPSSLPGTPGIERCLALTSVHEMGHALGIFAHSADPKDIMYTDPEVDLPSARDRRTAEAAYHIPATLEAVGP